MPAEADAMLAKHSGGDRFVAWLTSRPHLLAEVIPHLQDRDVPRDLVLFVYRFVLVALREPDKLTSFWLKYRDIFNRLKRSLMREAQSRVDSLNAGKTLITNEEPAVDELVKLTTIEVPPPAASSSPPDAEEQLSADAIALGVYVPDLPADVLAEYMPAIADLVEREPAQAPAISEVLPPLYEEVERLPPLPIQDEPSAPIAPRVIEEVTPPEHDPPSPIPTVLAITDEQPPLPLARAAPGDIETRNLAVALELVKAGLPIFPARVYWQDGRWRKKPIIRGWQLGSTDPERIRGWWRAYPKAVPGIALGRAGLVVADADRHGGPDGVAAFDKLVAEHGGLPIGPLTATAGGGLHYVFKQPDGKPLGNREGVLAGHGINVRGCSGWVVAPDAVCPDGSMWRTADGAPSLIEAYRNATIPIIPPWLVDLIRAPKRRKASKEETQENAPPRVDPTSTDKPSRNNMDRRGKRWAETVLKNGTTELAAKPPHSGRNEMANALGFQMGTMVRRGWIDRATVFKAVWAACERNGLAIEEAERTRDTIERAIADGMNSPHPDLHDDRNRAGRQRSGQHDDVWLRLRQTEIYRLLCIRHCGNATFEAARDVLVGLEDLDASELGKRLNFTMVEYQEIGRRFGRHPSTIAPGDATRERREAYLAGIKNSPEKKKAKADAEKARRLCKKQERAQQQASAPDLVAQRWAETVAFAKKHPGKPHTTHDLVRGLKRKEVFESLDDKTRRNAIVKLVGLAMSGKLPADHLIIAPARAKNGRDTFTIEYRK
jgi:Bifunctional DNA primase/polymerase, N-terminal